MIAREKRKKEIEKYGVKGQRNLKEKMAEEQQDLKTYLLNLENIIHAEL